MNPSLNREGIQSRSHKCLETPEETITKTDAGNAKTLRTSGIIAVPTPKPEDRKHMLRILFPIALIGISNCVLAQQQLTENWELQLENQALPQSICADQRNPNVFYACLKKGGLGIYRLSGPKRDSPIQIARVTTNQLGGLDVMDAVVRKDSIFLALGDLFKRSGYAGLAVLSVKDPANPKLLSIWKSEQELEGSAVVRVKNNLAFMGMMKHGVTMFDISNPNQIRKLSTILPDVNFPKKNPGRIQHPNARGMHVERNYLYVAYDAGGLRVVDISNPKRPTEVARYINRPMIGKQQAYNNIVVDKGIAYIGVDYAGVEILDVRNPRAPKQIGWWNPWDADTLKNLWFNSPGHINQVKLDPKNKLLYVSAGDSELQVLNVANPKQPRLVARVGEPKNKRGVWGLALTKDSVLLTYIRAVVPFQGHWTGIKSVARVRN